MLLIRRLILILPVFLLVVGCVNQEYVKAEIDPLKERLAAVEERLDALEAQNQKWESSLPSTNPK